MPKVSVRMKPPTGREPWVNKALQTKVDVVVTTARRIVPKDTGELLNSISGRVTSGRGGLIGVVEATAPHALFVHDGTGLYGPKKALIYPRRAKVMRFVTKGGDLVFTPYTRGMRARPFLADALRAVENPNLVVVSAYTRSTPSGRPAKVRAYVRRR
jgi:hypothetical protein